MISSLREGSRFALWALAITMATALTAVLVVEPGNASEPASVRAESEVPDPNLDVVEVGEVYTDEEGPPAFRPALTRAPNGDFLAVFNTTSDVQAGGEIHMVRSTDEGKTWSAPTVIRARSKFENGSLYSSRGMTTLSDGTILLPFNDAVLEDGRLRMDSEMYVARSTDNGRTWEGLDEPIELPMETREMWACCNRVLELDDGSLVMSVYGTMSLVDEWRKNPMRWRAGVIKSYDGGKTWTDFSQIAYDEHTPPFGVSPDGQKVLNATGINEPAVIQLRDGRLMAIIRHLTVVPEQRDASVRATYYSYSADKGATWSTPVQSSILTQTPSATVAPCSEGLPNGQTKVLFGYRDVTDATNAWESYSTAAVGVSFDNGATWPGKTYLEVPEVAGSEKQISAEADFWWLDDKRVLVLFQYIVGGHVAGDPTGGHDRYRLAYNILEDVDADGCREQARQSAERNQENLSVFLLRADYDQFPYNYARRQTVFPASTSVRAAADRVGPMTSCHADKIELRVLRDGRWKALPPGLSLKQAGVRTGDVIQVRNREANNGKRAAVGLADWDEFPEVRPVYGWNSHCAFPIMFDFQRRSIGIRTEAAPDEVVTGVHIRNSSSGTRLRPENFTVWESDDNRRWERVSDTHVDQEVDQDGRLVLSFGGLKIKKPYIKIHQSINDSRTNTATFVIEDSTQDVWLNYEPQS